MDSHHKYARVPETTLGPVTIQSFGEAEERLYIRLDSTSRAVMLTHGDAVELAQAIVRWHFSRGDE